MYSILYGEAPEPRIAVLTHSLTIYKHQFLGILNPEDRSKFKAVMRLDDLRGERFLSYLTLWDFGKEKIAEELLTETRLRLIPWH